MKYRWLFGILVLASSLLTSCAGPKMMLLTGEKVPRMGAPFTEWMSVLNQPLDLV